MAQNYLQEGINALQAGDRDHARNLLQQAVAQEPNNEMAWYYLAATQSDLILRRQNLERVLAINPNNSRAQEVLNQTLASLGAQNSPPASPASSYSPPTNTSPVRPLSSSGSTGASSSGGIALPVDIPGAPLRVDPVAAFRAGLEMIKNGANILMGKAGVVEYEMSQATWWRYWVLVVTGAVISAGLAILGAVFGIFRSQSIFNIILAPIFTLIFSTIITFGAGYISHWYAKTQAKGQGTLLQHVLIIALIFIPIAVLGDIISFLGSVLPFIGILGIATFFISVYGWYLLGPHFQAIHGFTDPNQKWITIAVYVAAGILIAVLVSPLLLMAGLSAALF